MTVGAETDVAIPPRISSKTVKLLARGVSGQVRFSDVYAEVAGLQDPEWWQKTDFDASLTDEVESAGFPHAKQVPIGLRPALANYGLVLVDDLVRSQTQRANSYEGALKLHADIRTELKESRKAVLALANFAPRDDKNTARGQNGSDFYLAISDSGLEAYVTPLDFLEGLDARNRIIALYRIPNEDHPEFNGKHEQFRSARVSRTRRHPGHLVPVFEYGNVAALLAAKADGSHPEDIIPKETRQGKIAYIDKFGNVKLDLSADEFDRVQKIKTRSKAVLLVESEGTTVEIPVHKAKALRTAPIGKLAIYGNCSDHLDSHAERHLVELMVRVNGNPSTSRETAAYKLHEQVEGLDIWQAEVSIQV